MKKILSILVCIFCVFQSIAFAKPTIEERQKQKIFSKKQEQVNELVYTVFRQSLNKKETFETLKNLFQDCQKNAKDQDFQKICDWQVKYGFWEQDQLSSISFSEVWEDIGSGDLYKVIPEEERSNTAAPWEILQYPYGNLYSLEFPDTWTVYLQPFFETNHFYYTFWYHNEFWPGEIALLVMKKGDTQRQSLAKIQNSFSEYDFWGYDDKSLKIKKDKATITVWERKLKNSETWEGDDYFLTYALQRNKTWKLESCEKARGEYWAKRVKVSKKQCLPFSKHFTFITSLP